MNARQVIATVVAVLAVTAGCTAPAPQALPGTASAQLATLIVRQGEETDDYERDAFGTRWKDLDRNGCGQRDDVLRRDLQAVEVRPGTQGCVIIAGTLIDPYTGAWVAFTKEEAGKVQIDHVVSLKDAWDSGAATWTEDRRERMANDFSNLRAVDGPTNASKGADSADEWLPEQDQCGYVAWQVAVKAEYGLNVTVQERNAMVTVLTTCPDQSVVTDTDTTPGQVR